METYLQVEGISKLFGDLLLFEGITFGIEKGQKVALVARNGAGKTSMLNIITGKDAPDAGRVNFKRDIRVAYLEQEPSLDVNKTMLDEVFSSSDRVVSVIHDYEQCLANGDKKKMEHVIHQMDTLNLWDYEAKVKQILFRLGLEKYDQLIGELSGGQRKRVALASVLINEPDLLILDEPSNHLDLEMIEWLETFLQKSSSTLLMVTHDRYFLDRVCNEIIEIDDKQVYTYKGNYSYFLEKRSERIAAHQVQVEKAKNLYRSELDWIRRMPQARATKAKYRIDAFQDIKQKAHSAKKEEAVKIDVKSSRLGKKIIELKNLSKAFGEKKVLQNFSYLFGRNEKVGIVGDNGSGKTTFLNLVTGVLKPDSGTVDIGDTVVYGYYKQEGITFDEGQRVIDIVREIAEVVTLGDGKVVSVSHFLNYFLFPPDTQYAHISKLSGGEKRRLYLVTVLMRNPNFLILDEPTNDLDIMTLNVLEEYLGAFNGCVIIVSHDRFFMDKVVDHLFIFNDGGIVKDFPGNYSLYREYALQNDKQPKQKEIKDPPPVGIPPDNQKKKLSFKEKIEYEKLEKEIQELEDEKQNLESLISSGTLKPVDLHEKSIRIGILLKLLDEKTDRWLELSELG